MPLAGRLLVIAFAFVAACVTAEMVFASAVITHWGLLSVVVKEIITYSAMLPTYGPPIRYGFALVFATALLPVILVATLSELFYLRSLTLYATAGALAGLIGYVVVVPSEHASHVTAHAPSIIEPHPISILVSGIAAGVVYWSIAGRKAGIWRGVKAVEAAN